MKTLEDIADCDPGSGAEATPLLGSICSFDFIFNLLILDEFFGIANILSKYLQLRDVPVVERSKLFSKVLKMLEMLLS